MAKEPHGKLFRSERILVDVHGEHAEIWFPDLTLNARYSMFVELVVGKLTGKVEWQPVEDVEHEYAFHLDNW